MCIHLTKEHADTPGSHSKTSARLYAPEHVRATTMRSITKSATLKVRGGREVDSRGKKAGKGALIQTERCATISATQDQVLFVWGGDDMKSVVRKLTPLE